MLHHQLNFELSFFHTFVYINVVLNWNLFAFTRSSPPINIGCFLISVQFIYSTSIFLHSIQPRRKQNKRINRFMSWCPGVVPPGRPSRIRRNIVELEPSQLIEQTVTLQNLVECRQSSRTDDGHLFAFKFQTASAKKIQI